MARNVCYPIVPVVVISVISSVGSGLVFGTVEKMCLDGLLHPTSRSDSLGAERKQNQGYPDYS